MVVVYYCKRIQIKNMPRDEIYGVESRRIPNVKLPIVLSQWSHGQQQFFWLWYVTVHRETHSINQGNSLEPWLPECLLGHGHIDMVDYLHAQTLFFSSSRCQADTTGPKILMINHTLNSIIWPKLPYKSNCLLLKDIPRILRDHLLEAKVKGKTSLLIRLIIYYTVLFPYFRHLKHLYTAKL